MGLKKKALKRKDLLDDNETTKEKFIFKYLQVNFIKNDV